jgi:hypothetical protein
VVADIGAVQEKPLSRLVLHAGLGELDLNSIYLSLAHSSEAFSFAYHMGGERP